MQHAIQICEAILRAQLTDSSATGLDGASDPTGRTAVTAARMEALLFALEFLPQGDLRGKVETTVPHGIGFLLRMQLTSGPFAGGMPGAFAPTAGGASEVRIDFVQHALCTWLKYREQT